jgi:uncharacterized protein YfiM (DUF2279 family)
MKTLAAALLLCASLAHAGGPAPVPAPAPTPSCTTGEKWTGSDKALHLAAGSLIAFGTTLGTENPWIGFAAGSAVGALKEISDRGAGCSSGKDLGVTIIGAALGAFVGNRVLVMKKNGMTVVAYQTDF